LVFSRVHGPEAADETGLSIDSIDASTICLRD
jgi:hypothetical protein